MAKGKFLTDKQIERLIQMSAEGRSKKAIMGATGKSRTAVDSAIKKYSDQITIKKREIQDLTANARLPQTQRSAEGRTEVVSQRKKSIADDVTEEPDPVITYGIQHNHAVKMFSEMAEETTKRMKNSMSDAIMKEFAEDMELVPLIRSMRIQYKETYESQKMTFAQYLQVGMKVFSQKVQDIAGLSPIGVKIEDPDAPKELNLNKILNMAIVMRIIENM